MDSSSFSESALGKGATLFLAVLLTLVLLKLTEGGIGAGAEGGMGLAMTTLGCYGLLNPYFWHNSSSILDPGTES